jgi:8-oxo-dGTP pyrophosphatase MutT (NUDIX family)
MQKETEIQENKCAGGIVIGDGGAIAMVRSKNSQSWLFPKGHIEAGETDEEAALRELAEETGLTNLEYIDDLGEFTRPSTTSSSETFAEKTIHMFLFMAPMHAELAPTLEIEEARWVPFREVAEILGTPHTEWFTRDRAWFATVFDRVREAIQRD